MPLSVPALAQLRCFEAAARHGSFTLAADELCLTPSAVSHQLRALEVALGVQLFARAGRKMMLTEAGRRYLEDIGPAFEQIGAATARVRATERASITIGVAPSFAQAWLVPHLPRFLQAHPQLDLRVRTDEYQPDQGWRDLDCEIRYGHGKWPGADVQQLAEDALLPLCSPSLLGSAGPPADIAALAPYPLIYTETRALAWDQWFRRRGCPVPRGRRLHFARSPLAIAAAAAGLGVALESHILAATELCAGTLIALTGLGPGPEPLGESYFLVRRRLQQPSPHVDAFAEWLHGDLSDRVMAALTLPPPGAPPPAGPAHPDSAPAPARR